MYSMFVIVYKFRITIINYKLFLHNTMYVLPIIFCQWRVTWLGVHLYNNLGPNHCMPSAPMGAVTSIEITEMVSNRVAHSLSSSEPILLAMSNATGASAAWTENNLVMYIILHTYSSLNRITLLVCIF